MTMDMRRIALLSSGALVVLASLLFLVSAIYSQWENLMRGSSQEIMELAIAIPACLVIAYFGVRLMRKSREKADSAEAQWPPKIS